MEIIYGAAMVRTDAHDRRPYKYLLELLGRSALCLRTFRIAFADAHDRRPYKFPSVIPHFFLLLLPSWKGKV